MALRPDLEGQQFSHISGSPYVYIVIDGILRWIKTPAVWMSLFTNWNVQTIDISGIDGFSDVSPPLGPRFPLPDTCRVVKGSLMPQVFLIDYCDPTADQRDLDYGDLCKRWIQSPAAMAAYGFRWPFGFQEMSLANASNTALFSASGGAGSSTVAPQIVIDAINTSHPLPLGGGIAGFPF